MMARSSMSVPSRWAGAAKPAQKFEDGRVPPPTRPTGRHPAHRLPSSQDDRTGDRRDLWIVSFGLHGGKPMTFEQCQKVAGRHPPQARDAVSHGPGRLRGDHIPGPARPADSDPEFRNEANSPYGILVLEQLGLTRGPETILQIADIPQDGLQADRAELRRPTRVGSDRRGPMGPGDPNQGVSAGLVRVDRAAPWGGRRRPPSGGLPPFDRHEDLGTGPGVRGPEVGQGDRAAPAGRVGRRRDRADGLAPGLDRRIAGGGHGTGRGTCSPLRCLLTCPRASIRATVSWPR